MLTKSERTWLRKRKKPCTRCIYSDDEGHTCGLLAMCKEQGYPDGGIVKIKSYQYKDAAEFEARVAVIALRLGIEDVPCAHGMDMFCPAKHFKGQGCGDWCRMRMAHLQAEEEMDNARS